jgi:hypothetical protein
MASLFNLIAFGMLALSPLIFFFTFTLRKHR